MGILFIYLLSELKKKTTLVFIREAKKTEETVKDK